MSNHSVIAGLPLPNLTSLAFLLVAFLTGIATALQTPTLSLFLTNEVHASRQMVGLFFTISAIIGISCSQFLAKRSDNQGERRRLILFCCLCGVLGCLLFAWCRNYFLLLFVAVLLTSFGNAANPQIFALAREYADQTRQQAAMFSAILRAQISLAWVVGPPLAYALASGFGFSVMYLGTVITFFLCGVVSWLFLPAFSKTVNKTANKNKLLHASSSQLQQLQAPRCNRQQVLLLFIICTMMWSANGLYLITMPLYITHDLHLPDKLAGVMMGSAAGLEIPTMLIAGYYARKSGKRLLMRIAMAGGLVFYLLVLTAHTPVALIMMQLLNALFIGILAGISMSYFQDLMPGQAGSATTLCANTSAMGWIVSGLFAGFISDLLNYHAVFYFALLLVIISGVCLWRIRDI